MNSRCDVTLFDATSRHVVRGLLPALAVLEQNGRLDPDARIVAASFRPVDRASYRSDLRRVLEAEVGPSVDGGAMDRLLERLTWIRLDPSDDAHWSRLAKALERGGTLDGQAGHVVRLPRTPVATRLVCSGLRRWDLLRTGSRALLDAPVGSSLGSVRGVGRVVANTFAETQIYRLSAALGLADPHQLTALRRTTARAVDHVQITVAEAREPSDAASERGALRRMVQSHGLSLLSLVATSPPGQPGPEAVRDARLDVLRSLKPLKELDVDRWTVRGRYLPRPLPGGPSSQVRGLGRRAETFVALRAELSTRDWEGVPFYLRVGTGLRVDSTSVVVTYTDGTRSEWSAGLQPEHLSLGPRTAADSPAAVRTRAHASLLTSAIRGDVTRFLRADEVEAAWEWIEPIAHRWDSSPGRPSPYRASRVGPLDAAHLLGREGRAWHDVAC